MQTTSYRLPFRLLGIPELFGLSVDADALKEGITPYLLGFLGAVGLFLSVLIHELGHSVVGLHYDLKIKKITLWILGGMAQFERMPRRPGAEAVVAIAGPVTSYAVGIFCWLLLRSVPQEIAAAHFVVAYLMYMNFILATFNLLPALPLDGGRMLRSLLAMRMTHLEATQYSVTLSKFLALFLGLFGFISFNPFMILIALFIYMAGSGEGQMATVTEMLQGIRVSDLMTHQVKTVSPDTSVAELIQRMLQEGHLGYPVTDDRGRVVGMATLHDVRRMRSSAVTEDEVTVGQIMREKFVMVQESASALEAFHRMSRDNFNRLIVVDTAQNIVGILSKTDLIRAIQVKMVGQSLERPSPLDSSGQGQPL
jgi:Zn-dependent protease